MKSTADAICRTLESHCVLDLNLEPANVVDVIDRLARCVARVGGAITREDAAPGTDANGGNVGSLTEAVMGVTAGLFRIADSVGELADAVRGCVEN